MDAGALIRAAREQARLSQAQLAHRAGTSQGKLADYERGRVSPTVRTLDRMLAAAGLQARIALEPLLADVDLRVDAMVAGSPTLRLEELLRLAPSLAEEQRWVEDPDVEPEDEVWTSGQPRWAFDGATALNLHGLAVEHASPAVVLVWEPAAQGWLTQVWAQGLARTVGWWSVDLDEARLAASRGVFCRLGLLAVRFESALPSVVTLRPPGADEVVPVVSVDEVERSSPAHAEVLARWRERRGGG